MKDSDGPDRTSDRWARLRFAIVGALLAAPPKRGELRERLEELAAKEWVHPRTSRPVKFGLSTIERWLYQARRESADPFGALRRRIRRDAGTHPSLGPGMIQALEGLYRDHPSWTYHLHWKNLGTLVRRNPEWGDCPAYETVRRFMRRRGWTRKKRIKHRSTAGWQAATRRFESRETRTFEVEYVNGLWHLDFHEGSRKVIGADGRWKEVQLLGVLDDHSRLACHLQWYLDEATDTLVHGLSQAIQKRGLPRSLMTDNGAAMKGGEFVGGLDLLGIHHDPTLPYSPHQNGKQESFWGTVEGQVIAMLEGVEELTLELLNEATQAWVELEYNREYHSELRSSPCDRYLAGQDVGRPSPSSEELRKRFRREIVRTQRRSDGTVTIDGTRFEIPSRFRNLEKLHIRYARWDLRLVDLVDPRSGALICAIYPQDKAANAEGLRRAFDDTKPLEPPPEQTEQTEQGSGIAPRLEELMKAYASTGLPPGFITKPEKSSIEDRNEERE